MCTLPLTALSRKWLGALMAIFKINAEGFQCTMGYNMGDEWNKKMMVQLGYFDPVKEGENPAKRKGYLCLDGKFYDIIGDEKMTYYVGVIIYMLLSECGYTPAQARMAQKVFYTVFNVINCLRADYYFTRFILPSGAVITWLYNCIKSFMAYVIAYKRLVIDIPPELRGNYQPRFGKCSFHGAFPNTVIDKNYRDMVRAWFCGDDAAAYLHALIRSLMTQEKIAEVLKKDVIEVQPEDKSTEFQDNVTYLDVKFMKRTYRLLIVEGKEYHVSPIDPESLAKTLSHIDISSALSETENVKARLDNFMREMFHYGPEEYETAAQMLVHSDIPQQFIPNIVSWHSLAERFLQGDMQPW